MRYYYLVYLYAVPTPVVSITVRPGPLFAGEVESLTCTATLDLTIVDYGNILYSFTWRDREGNTVVSGSRTIITQTSSSSSLTLSPLNTMDTNFTCTVRAMESINRLVSSTEGNDFVTIINVHSEFVGILIRAGAQKVYLCKKGHNCGLLQLPTSS